MQTLSCFSFRPLLLLHVLLLPPSSLLIPPMLSSLNSHEEGHRHYHHHHLLPRQLLVTCAELVHRSDIPAARHAISLLLSAVSPHGDASDRAFHQFALALSLRIDRLPPLSTSATAAALHSSYLSLNQVTPFLRFAHLTANQAILEAVDGRRRLHILDFDTLHGVQWPPLLQAIAERSDPANPPSIRITGTGADLDVLRRTGDRLRTFADSLGLPFQFHPLLLSPPSVVSSGAPCSSCSLSPFSVPSFQVQPGETLAVNCVHFLHKLIKEGSDGDAHSDGGPLSTFLQSVKAMGPAVVTVAEREANHSSPIFLQRFMEALDYYSALFESLEATLPPKSRERVSVEQAWFGREIAGVIAGDERHERFDQWEKEMKAAGFGCRPLSPFALQQARLLLRLHYPSEGYQLQEVNGSFFLGWQSKPLFSVSSWH